MTVEEAMNNLPPGDFNVELELVLGGWVAYVWLTPVHGAIVPADRDSIHTRSDLHPTRAGAIAAIPETLKNLASKVASVESGAQVQ